MAPLTVPARYPTGPTLPQPGAPGGQDTARGIAPSGAEAADALALFALTMIGIVGFRVAYGGMGYLIAGAIGVLAGLLLSHLGQRLRLPLLAVAALAAIVFLLSAGPVSQLGLPAPAVLREVFTVTQAGWQQLLTSGRPVGSTGGLLVLPYLLGMFSGVAGHALARGTDTRLLPAAPPAVVVALSILFGAGLPADAGLQGTGFAVLAVVWAAVRQHRSANARLTLGRRRSWQRIMLAGVVLAVAAAGATVLAPRLPGAGAHQRVVLTVVPPYDVSMYPSPLAGFRDYTQDVPAAISVYGKELLAANGLPAGGRIRIAAMDTYDGYAWGVANAAASGDTFDGFQRVGSVLPAVPSGVTGGKSGTVAITIEPGYNLSWLPDLPGTTGLAFTGAAGAAAESALRFNVATGTGLLPGGVTPGLTYTVTASLPPDLSGTELAAATPYGSPDPSILIPPAVQAFAAAHTGAASTPMGKVMQLASYLRTTGQYSNGAGVYASSVLPGHEAGRLATFLAGKPVVGDDEQYAAAMALLAAEVGVPARVSLDATVEGDGSVYGRDVRADVELDLAEYGWVTLPASQFTGTSKPTLEQRKTVPPAQPVRAVPPRRNGAAPVSEENQSGAASRSGASANHPPAAHKPVVARAMSALVWYVGIPVLAVLAIIGLLLGAKSVRRSRRRGHGPPAARVAAAWRELLDLGRDLGIRQSGHATRREQAAHAEAMGMPQTRPVAVAADAAVFGPQPPDADTASAVWALADQARRAATSGLPPLRRLWVALNPVSLFTPA